MTLSPQHFQELQQAHALLENPGFMARTSHLLGRPIEYALAGLPKSAKAVVAAATEKALKVTLAGALGTMDKTPASDSPRLHKMLATVSGAAGGFFGLAALPVELPVSTGVIFRSIADIARANGEDIHSAEVKLECLKVFGMGGPTNKDDAGESGYLALRSSMAKLLSEAADYLVANAVAGEGAPVLVRVIAAIASRFQVQVTEKLAAQAVPVIGAVAGATINFLFVSHFQDMSRGHFTVRRLERIYGSEVVLQAYERLGAVPAADERRAHAL